MLECSGILHAKDFSLNLLLPLSLLYLFVWGWGVRGQELTSLHLYLINICLIRNSK